MSVSAFAEAVNGAIVVATMAFDRVLKTVLFVGIFFVPFIPFIVSNSMFFPFITGKNFTFRILVELLFFVWAILAIKNSSYRPSFSWIMVAVSSFLAVIAVADVTGFNPAKSIWSNFERMEGLVSLLHLGAYFFVLGTVLQTQKLWNVFFNTSIGASILMGLYGVYQLSGAVPINQGGVRLDARFGNATYLGVYMLFMIFITLIMLVKWRGANWVRYLYGAMVLFQTFILYQTATRGAILGLLGGLVLTGLLLVILERERMWVRKAGIGVLVGITLLVGGFIAVKDSDFVQNSDVMRRFANMSFDSGTVQSRFLIWDMAWQGIKERPILGWGQENFNIIFNKYYNPDLHGNEPWFDRVHNIVFDWLVAGGFLGFLAYIAMPLSLMYYLWIRARDVFPLTERALLTGLLAAYGFYNIFTFDNLVSYIYFFSILAYVYARTKPELTAESKWAMPVSEGTAIRLVTPFVLIAMVVTMVVVNRPGMVASQTMIEALQSHYGRDNASSMQKFQETIALGVLGRQEAREQLLQAATRAIGHQDIDQTARMALYEYARSEMEKQLEDMPGDARHELFLGTLYDAYGQYDLAAAHYENAQQLSPNKQAIRFARGSNMLNRNQNEEAVQLFAETLDLARDFATAHVMYITALIYSGQHAAAEEAVQQAVTDYGNSDVLKDQRLTRAYFDSGQYAKARENIELILEDQPNNRDMKLNIVLTYIREEDTENAVATVERIITEHPDFEVQGRQLINDILSGTVF